MTFTHTETDLPIERQYPKLVRDRIPEIIEKDGKIAHRHIAGDEEYVSLLLSKLIEEASELKDAQGLEHQKEEIADVREVLKSIQLALGFSDDDVAAAVQASKAEARGGFEGRIILDLSPE